MNLQLKSLTLAVMLAVSSMPTMAEEQKVAVHEESDALPEVNVNQSRIRAGTPRDAAYTGSKTDTPLRE
jgi:hypothetical protein